MAIQTRHQEETRFIRIVYIIGFLDLFGVSLIIPQLMTHMKSLGASPATAGFIGSIYGALQLVSSPLIGKWSDVGGRRYVLVVSLLISALGYSLIGAANTLFLFALARIPTGLFKHSMTISKAFIADVVPERSRPKAFGDTNAFSSLGFIVGPVIGGHIAELPYGFHIGGFLTAAIFFLSAGLFNRDGIFFLFNKFPTNAPRRHTHNTVISWLFLPSDQEATAPHPHRPTDATREDSMPPRTTTSDTDEIPFHPLAFVKSFRDVDWHRLWDVFLLRFLMSFAVILLRTSFSLVMSYHFGATPRIIGYVMSYSGIVAAICGLFVGRIIALYRGNDNRLLTHTTLLTTVTIFGLALSPNLLVFVFWLTPLGLANAVGRVAMSNVTMKRCRPPERGALMGLSQSTMSLARTLAPAVGGLAQTASEHGVGATASLFATLGVALCFGLRDGADGDGDGEKGKKSQ